MIPTYHIYVSDCGNIFMTEIATLLDAALSDLGFSTVYPAPGLPEPDANRRNLVVAPHEFFPLQRGVGRDDLMRAAECSVVLGVEQPGTLWFELGSEYASVAAAVLDISRVAVDELVSRGIEATHLQLGYHESWDFWDRRTGAKRSRDLLFLGSRTSRRDQLLSAMAGLLWDAEADLRLFEFPKPMSEPRGLFVAGADKFHLLADSRVLLNVHRNDVPYLEWVRVLEAIVNGCVVVTETSDDYGPLVPGEHILVSPPDCLGAYTSALLMDEGLRTEVALAAYDLVRSKVRMTDLLEPVCARLAELDPVGTARTPLTYTPPVAEAPAENPLIEQTLASELQIRARVKELKDSETSTIREIEAMQAELTYGNRDHAVVRYTPAWKASEPKVSVVITSYETAEMVGDAIDSVLASCGIAAELVVVDDHSRDDSVAVIEGRMAANPGFPMAMVARSANAGVSVARNTGVATCRGEHIFILDSDNEVYPNSLRKLSAALDRDPKAAYAYGILAMSNGQGLLSFLPWDLVRLCEANYIDAMAMIRASALGDVGGYDLDFGLRGWEDYEMWLRMAAAGYEAAFVPAFVGSYRVRAGSRQETVNLDNPFLFNELRRRYPYLPWMRESA